MRLKLLFLSAALTLLTACLFSEPQRPEFTPPATPPPVISTPPSDPGTPLEDTVCAQIYAPVCGKIQIQCFTTPCDPVWETFPNRCEAEKRGALEIKEGICEDQTT